MTTNYFPDIFEQGRAFVIAYVRSSRQQFNAGVSRRPKSPFLEGSNFHRSWIAGVRDAEKELNFDTGI